MLRQALLAGLLACLLVCSEANVRTKYLLHHQAKKVMLREEIDGQLVVFQPLHPNVIEFAATGSNELVGALAMDVYLSRVEYFPTRIEYGRIVMNPSNFHKLFAGVHLDVPEPSTGWKRGWNTVSMPLTAENTLNPGLCAWNNATRFAVYRSGPKMKLTSVTDSNEFIKLRRVRLVSSKSLPTDVGTPVIQGGQIASFVSASNAYASAAKPGLSFPGTNSFTLEAWVYPQNPVDDDGADQLSAVMGLINLGQGGEYLLSFDDKGVVSFHRSTNIGPNLYAKTIIRRKEWSHLACTYDGDTKMMSVFVNGVLNGQQVSNAQATATSDMKFTLGATPSAAHNNDMVHRFDGFMSDVKVWKAARSPLAVVKSMRGFLGNTADLAAHWLYKNGFQDDSGNNRNLGGHSVQLVSFAHSNPPFVGAETSPVALLDFVATYVCPAMCSGNGVCFRGRCACDSEHKGLACSEQACPNDCSGHGNCATSSTSCTCEQGYSGADCSTFACPAGCDDHGVCTGDGKCECDSHVKEGGHWIGPSCAVAECHLGCSGHGTCNTQTGMCNCLADWKGAGCALPKCPSACSGHGKCDVRSAKCTCDYIWGGSFPKDISTIPGADHPGPDCSLKIGPKTSCPYDCNYKGQCDNGKCVCNEGSGGDFCEERDCPGEDPWHGKPACSGHGACNRVTGECRCDGQWVGDSCEEDHYCWKNCSSRGTCRLGKCWCTDGFHGDGCEKSFCEQDENGGVCSGHGKCGCDGCKCEGQWGGGNCDLSGQFPMKCVTLCDEGCATKCARATTIK